MFLATRMKWYTCSASTHHAGEHHAVHARGCALAEQVYNFIRVAKNIQPLYIYCATNMNETNVMFHLLCMDVSVTAGIFNQSQLSKVKKFVASKVDGRQLGGRCLDFSTLFCDAKKHNF